MNFFFLLPKGASSRFWQWASRLPPHFVAHTITASLAEAPPLAWPTDRRAAATSNRRVRPRPTPHGIATICKSLRKPALLEPSPLREHDLMSSGALWASFARYPQPRLGTHRKETIMAPLLVGVLHPARRRRRLTPWATEAEHDVFAWTAMRSAA